MTTLNNTLRLLQLQIQQSQSPAISVFGAAPYHPGTPTLPAPQVPALLVHNGLNKNDLHDPSVPVSVQVVLQSEILENDDLTLYLNDTAVAVETVRPEHVESGIVTFYLLPSVFPQEGQVTLHYHHRVPPSDSFSVSENAGPFLVKQTVPGDPDPEPATPTINERLTPPTGIPNPVPPGQPLTVTIPRYVNIAGDDKIVLHWSNREIHKTVTADEASNSGAPLTVIVPPDIIDSTPGLDLIVRYEIHDTVMNWSLYSLEARTDVVPPEALHAPTVRDANDYDELDMDELDGDEVAIQIPVNGNLPVGTEGVLTWTGIPVIGPRMTFTLAFKIERTATRITLMVPNEKAKALVGSTATVYYEATLNGVSTPSQRTSVVVIGEPVTLAEPTLTGVAGDTYNPASVIGTHQEVVVPAYGFMARGQAVILHWEGRTASGSPFYIQERKEISSNTQQDVHFLIDKIYATGLGTNTILKVYYEIVAEGTTYASPTLELTVVGVPSNLPKPTTDPVFANGEIDPGAIVDAIEVVIEPNSSLAPGDLLTVKWLGRSNASIILTDQIFPRSGSLKIRIGKTPYIDGNSNGYVDVSYEARRNGQPVGSSQVLQLHVGAAAELPWPLPKVVDGTGGEVSTWQPVKPGTSYESNTATVVVTDSRILAGDTVAIIWRLPGGTDLTVPWITAGAGEGRVPVPSTVLARSLGQTVQVGYVVFRGAGADLVGNSALANLQVGTLPANALSELIILEAANNGTGPEFDVSRLAGDATLRVGRWPMIEVGQPVWLKLEGTKADASSYTKAIWQGGSDTTNPVWVDQGFYTAPVIPISELQGLRDGSELRVIFKAGLDGNQVETNAVMFMPKVYRVRAVVDIKPIISNVRDSSGDVSNGGTTLDTRVTLAGSAAANQQLELFDGAVSKAVITVDSSGNWNYTLSGLTVKTYSLTVQAKYGSGQSSVAWAFDAIAYQQPVISRVTDSRGGVANGGDTYDTTIVLTGTANRDQRVQILDGSTIKGEAIVSAAGSWAYTLTGLGVGAHSVTAKALYGEGSASSAWQINVRQVAPLTIDTQEVYLRVGQSITRQAYGGVPPYLYFSTNPESITLTQQGTVTVRARPAFGGVGIGVNDSAGGRVSYHITVLA